MTGLILKDFLILRKTLRSYLLILAIYVAVAFTGYWSSSFVGGFMMVMVALRRVTSAVSSGPFRLPLPP